MKEKETRSYSVISKGEYSYKQTNEFLLIDRFLIIRKKSRRFLLLNFNNLRNETLTGLTLQIDQFDAHGNPLGAANKTIKDLAFKKGKFILKNNVELHRSCIDFRLKIVRAEYGNFAYCLGENDVYVTYEKRKKKQPIDRESIQKEVGEEGVSVQRRKFGIPAIVGVISAVTLICGAIASVVHLNKFKDDEESFFLNNIEYEFVDQEDRSADAPVNIVGYVGLGGDSIVIPNSVDGHPVYQIAEEAFMYNEILEEVVIEGGVRIGLNAFRGCTNLEKVEIKDNVTIGAYAFAECSSLQSFSANNLEEIGLGAFNYCDALASVKLTGDKYSVLELDSQVFANCSALTDIYIDQFVEYEMDGRYFVNTKTIENLYLKNYNYSQYEADTGKGLSALLGESAKVKNITIGNMDDVPASFVSGCGSALETFTVKNFQGSKIGNDAFQACPKLTAVSVSGGVSVVGDNAFNGCKKLTKFSVSGVQTIGENAFKETAITTFDASSVSSLGKFAFEHCTNLTDVGFTSSTPLTTIPERAFSTCTALQTLIVPAAVTTIEEAAFSDCAGVSQVLFTQTGLLETIGKEAFYGLKSIKTLDLPDGVISIGSGAFASCVNLRFLYIPASVQMIAEDALLSCYKLYEIENLSATSVYAINELRVYTSAHEERMPRQKQGDFEFAYARDEWYLIEYDGLGGKVKLPESVAGENYRIVPYMFTENETITQLTIPDAATRIGENAFGNSGISSLQFIGESPLVLDAKAFDGNAFESVDFGERELETLRAELFANSETLETVVLSPKTLYVANGAFANCDELQTVTLPNGILSIGSEAFINCSSLESVQLPMSLIELGASAFENCTSIESVAFGDNLTALGARAFYGCESLQNAFLPASLTAIAVETFANCVELSTVEFGNGLMSIGSCAFLGCEKLSYILLPSTLTFIDSGAFGGCRALHEVCNLSTLPITVNDADYGEVAYNAVVVHTAAGTRLQTATVDGLVFKYATNGVCALVDYTGSATKLTLDKKSVNGRTKTYIIARYAFWGDESVKTLIVGNGVTDMRSQAFDNVGSLEEIRVSSGVSLNYEGAFNNCTNLSKMVLSATAGTVTGTTFYNQWGFSIYFEGTQSQWNNNFATKWNTLSFGMIYIYDNCAHQGDQWNYDANNNVQTPCKEYKYSVLKDATCRQDGTGKIYCNDCGYEQKEVIPAYGHSYSDNVCMTCGYINDMRVTSYTLNNFKQVFTVSNTSKTPFRLFTNYDSIESTNKTANSTATLTFTAKQDMTISFTARVYGANTGALTVKAGTSTSKTLKGGSSSQSLSYTVHKGQTLTFTYMQSAADESGYAQINNMYITSLNEPY